MRADEAEADASAASGGSQTESAGSCCWCRGRHGDWWANETGVAQRLMEAVVERSNLMRAYQRVVENKERRESTDSRCPSSSHGCRRTGRG